nr:cytochrome P450 736Q2 [Ginkgo biloba]
MGLQELIQSLSAQQGVVATAAVLLILFSIFKGQKNPRYKLPPGPNPWPVIGNLHMLGKLPHRNLQALAKKYGPIMSLRLGSVRTVVVSSPEMAKEFLKTQDAIFSSRPTTLTGAKYLTYNFKNVAHAPYGPYWRHMKKLCTMELLSPKRIDSFRSVREEEISLLVDSLWQESEHGKKSVNLTKKLTSLTTSIMCRVIFGRKYSEDDMTGRKFKEIIQEMNQVAAFFFIGDFVPSLRWIDSKGVLRRVKNVHKIFDSFAEKVIDEHVERMKINEQKEGRKDFIDVLLEMKEKQSMEIEITRENIKALILDMLVGGVDTSATTLEWAIAELLRNPQIMKRAQKEIESVVGKDRRVKESDVPSLEYVQCVMKETLRLHATSPLLPPHESTEACTVGGYILPPKTRLIVNAWAITTDPAVWEDPLAFNPERFMGKDINLKGQMFDMIPFGSGRRSCPGVSMALVVLEFTLAQLLHCFEWSLEDIDPQQLDMSEIFALTVARRNPLYVVPKAKLPDGILGSVV